MCVMLAYFHAPSILSCANEMLNNSVKEYSNWSEHSFNTRGDISHLFVNLSGSIFFPKFLRTSCAYHSFVESISLSEPWNIFIASGTLLFSSLETLLNVWFRNMAMPLLSITKLLLLSNKEPVLSVTAFLLQTELRIIFDFFLAWFEIRTS